MLENLKPERVFYYFEKMCGIPHGSGNTKQISDFCVSCAEKLGLPYVQDAFNNVIIIKEASEGYENSPAVIIQGHLDMVCEKTADCKKNMEKEGLDLYIDGDKIRAKNTTLGGDDGIAVAMALAILEDDSLKHPRIEAVFTIDEEIGLLGAAALDVSPLQAKRMINLDSEEEGIFTVSCAGGNTMEGKLPLHGQPYSGECLKIRISGLEGGHSGAEIHKQRGNSNILMARMLQRIEKETGLQLISVTGGLKDNAIPLDTSAMIVCDNQKKVEAVVNEMGELFRKEYQVTDPGMTVSLTTEHCENVCCYDELSTKKAVTLLDCLPNGVQKMSMDIEGLVQTSLNLGVVKTSDDVLTVSFCVRSSVDSERDALNEQIEALVTLLGGSVEIRGAYPGWEYRKESSLRDCMCRIYEEEYGKQPVVEAIHAGLECGLFAGKISDLDCVSIGPDARNVHTVNESMSISSVARVYSYVCKVLEALK